MFEHHPNLTAFRGCMVAVCLALLAGCLPRSNNPAAPVPGNIVATAGNAAQQNDAAAACLVVAEDKLASLGLAPIAFLAA